MAKAVLQLFVSAVLLSHLLLAQNLFVTGTSSNTVVQYDGSTGAPLGVFANGVGLVNPTGLTFGPDGNLYVASLATGEIRRYDGKTGAFLGVFNTVLLPFMVDLEFGPDGNLYATMLLSGAVVKFDGMTGDPLDLINVQSAPAGILRAPTGLAFGPDGYLYVATVEGEILRFDIVSGAPLGVFAGGGGLGGLVDLTFGPDGNLYVTVAPTEEVLRFSGSTGAFIDVFASGGGLSAPGGIAFGPDGHLYVVSSGTTQVLRYDGATGAFLGVFASGGGLESPTFLAFKPTGNKAAESPFQVRYVANLNVADSLINITNTGTNGAMPFGPGIGPQAGNICVNVYAFSPDEQLVGCCSCHITPNGLVSLSAYNDIRAVTLTGLTPNSMVIKLVATAAGAGPSYSGGASACSQSAAGINVTHPVAPGGMAAWATTAHVPGLLPVPGAPAPFAITETRFTPATLSRSEITSLNNRCTAIIGNGSTFGTCRSCTSGGRGAGKQ